MHIGNLELEILMLMFSFVNKTLDIVFPFYCFQILEQSVNFTFLRLTDKEAQRFKACGSEEAIPSRSDPAGYWKTFSPKRPIVAYK